MDLRDLQVMYKCIVYVQEIERYMYVKCVFFSEGFQWGVQMVNEITIQLTLRKLFVSIYTKLFLY